MRWLREPLLHFIVGGLVLYGLGQWYSTQHDARRIVITPQRFEQIARRYAAQFGAPPGPEIRQALLDDDIHQEILYREGKRLGLDRDDEIVRRRIVQKAQFLLQDTAAPAEPSVTELAAFYDANRRRYVAPARTSFGHVYVSADAGEAAARRRAQSILARLGPARTRAPEAGDPFPDLYDFAAYDAQQTERLFGASELATAVSEAPIGRWSGPFRSGFGWHLLYISARSAAHQLTLDAAREQVRADYLREARQRANARAYDELARRYSVVRTDR